MTNNYLKIIEGRVRFHFFDDTDPSSIADALLVARGKHAIAWRVVPELVGRVSGFVGTPNKIVTLGET